MTGSVLNVIVSSAARRRTVSDREINQQSTTGPGHRKTGEVRVRTRRDSAGRRRETEGELASGIVSLYASP